MQSMFFLANEVMFWIIWTVQLFLKITFPLLISGLAFIVVTTV